MEVVAGMDSSGNFKYIGVVIGDISAIKRLYKNSKQIPEPPYARLKLYTIHLSASN